MIVTSVAGEGVDASFFPQISSKGVQKILCLAKICLTYHDWYLISENFEAD